MALVRRRKTAKVAEEVAEATKLPVDSVFGVPIAVDKVVSTGSTLLDLAISGKRRRGGGIPGGVLVEVFGPAGSGKTAVLAEICASAQYHGGSVMFLDPEARLDQEYARIYGLSLTGEGDYSRPDTVTQVFEEIRGWDPQPSNPEAISVVGVDSLAALSTEMELAEGDKMGMRRAKEFSQELRKTCRLIANNGWLIVCTNQIRESQEKGEVTPGGRGIPFYASLRIRVAQKNKLTKTKRFGSKEIVKTIGIRSEAVIVKSTVDDPFRTAPLFIVFGVGIDDVRGNLVWLKEVTGSKRYDCLDREFAYIDKAIEYIEQKGYEGQLRERVIEMWEKIEREFVISRKPKERW